MAITTENTYLIYSASGSTYAKLVDIKEFPDLMTTPGTVEITTLSDHMKRYLAGLKDTGTLEFKANYDLADYKKLVALEGTEGKYGVQFGKEGEDGVFIFDGEMSVTVAGGGTEAAVDMGVNIIVSSEVELSDSVKVTIA